MFLRESRAAFFNYGKLDLGRNDYGKESYVATEQFAEHSTYTKEKDKDRLICFGLELGYSNTCQAYRFAKKKNLLSTYHKPGSKKKRFKRFPAQAVQV